MIRSVQGTVAGVCRGIRASLAAAFVGAVVMAGCGNGHDGGRNGAIVISSSNWRRHDRSHDTAAIDHGRNLLDSCGHGAILFTLGDNDTYPLWYLQQVAGYRTDVTVVNLSLLNAPWYIRQLRDTTRSGLLADLSDEFIDRRLTGGMTSYTTLRWPVEPSSMTAAGIRWLMPPSWVAPDSSFGMISTAGYLVVRIIDETGWSRSIYFASSCAPTYRMGLEPYLVREGLVLRLADTPSVDGTIRIDTERTAANLSNVYRLGAFTDPSVYRSPGTGNILDIYADTSLALMEAYARTGNMTAAAAEAERARILASGHPGRRRSLDEALSRWGLDRGVRKNNGGTAP